MGKLAGVQLFKAGVVGVHDRVSVTAVIQTERMTNFMRGHLKNAETCTILFSLNILNKKFKVEDFVYLLEEAQSARRLATFLHCLNGHLHRREERTHEPQPHPVR